jgi:hypothetical protein
MFFSLLLHNGFFKNPFVRSLCFSTFENRKKTINSSSFILKKVLVSNTKSIYFSSFHNISFLLLFLFHVFILLFCFIFCFVSFPSLSFALSPPQTTICYFHPHTHYRKRKSLSYPASTYQLCFSFFSHCLSSLNDSTIFQFSHPFHSLVFFFFCVFIVHFIFIYFYFSSPNTIDQPPHFSTKCFALVKKLLLLTSILPIIIVNPLIFCPFIDFSPLHLFSKSYVLCVLSPFTVFFLLLIIRVVSLEYIFKFQSKEFSRRTILNGFPRSFIILNEVY